MKFFPMMLRFTSQELVGLLLFFTPICFLPSCATANIKASDFLVERKQEGYYVAIISVSDPGIYETQIVLLPKNTELDRISFSLLAGIFDRLQKGANWICIKLPAGRYALQYVTLRPGMLELDPVEVVIEKGKICYAGYLRINIVNPNDLKREFNYYYGNAFHAVREIFSQRYPELYKRYEMINVFPTDIDNKWYYPHRFF